MNAPEDFDYVGPEWLMDRDELRSAKAYLRGIEKRWEKKRILRDQKPRGCEAKLEKLSSEIDDLNDSLDVLCESVLKRALGLERYMVLRVARSDSYQVNLQALEFRLTEFGHNNRLAWHIEGRATRKNGTLGEKADSIMFDVARIERRRLDGTWDRLTLRDDCESSSK